MVNCTMGPTTAAQTPIKRWIPLHHHFVGVCGGEGGLGKCRLGHMWALTIRSPCGCLVSP